MIEQRIHPPHASNSALDNDSLLPQEDEEDEIEEEDEERVEDLEIYRLDYEKIENEDKDDDHCVAARAAGGEVLEPGDHVYMWCTLY